MTVEIAPGPASRGVARGVIEMSIFSIPSRISSLVSRLGLSALSISSDDSPSTRPPAIRNAGRVTPKSRRMSPPAVAKTIRMRVEATDAFSAMARLFSGGSPAVIVRNDGMAASGSTMKKIEMIGMSHVSTKVGMVARLYPKDCGPANGGPAFLRIITRRREEPGEALSHADAQAEGDRRRVRPRAGIPLARIGGDPPRGAERRGVRLRRHPPGRVARGAAHLRRFARGDERVPGVRRLLHPAVPDLAQALRLLPALRAPGYLDGHAHRGPPVPGALLHLSAEIPVHEPVPADAWMGGNRAPRHAGHRGHAGAIADARLLGGLPGGVPGVRADVP